MVEKDLVDPVYTLWKVDDKAWMKQRRAEWKIIEETVFHGRSKREIADNKRFFLKGAKEGYLGDWSVYLFVPFTNEDEARLAFFSSLFRHPHGKEQVLSSFVFNGMLWGKDMPWIRRSMQAFSDGVLGKEYRNPHCVDFANQEIRAPSPVFYSRSFCRVAIQLFSREIGYHGIMECFDYYFSMICSGFSPEDKSDWAKIPEMISAAEVYLASDAVDEDVAGFAKKVLENRDQLMTIYEGWQR